MRLEVSAQTDTVAMIERCAAHQNPDIPLEPEALTALWALSVRSLESTPPQPDPLPRPASADEAREPDCDG